MILPIYIYGHPILRKKASDVPADFSDIHALIDNMFETMTNASGVGLAAPQIGLSLRLFVVDTTTIETSDEKFVKRKQAFINPTILNTSKEMVSIEEGCLSIPNFREKVERSEQIEIQYLDENRQRNQEVFDGMFARVILHEYDHIEGKLFVDKLSILKKERIKKALKNISLGDIDVDYPYKTKK